MKAFLHLIDTLFFRLSICPRCYSWRVAGRHLFTTCKGTL